nr:hypothetical protein HmN_000293700 [Hymenolepis microstoma]
MSEFDAGEVAKLALMVKERSKEMMIECLEEKDYKGYQYAESRFELATQYLDDFFTSDIWQTDDDSSNNSN